MNDLEPLYNGGNIIFFPQFEELKNKVEQLRTELSMLLLERDQLQYVECKNIEMEYLLQLGSLEYKLYEAQCTALRLKRKIELIQAKKNRQEQIILNIIESILDDEFKEYQAKLDEQINRMNDALKRSTQEVLSDEDYKELKKLYRKIVKSLHPDLNPKLSPAQVKLFQNAVEAYKSGDLTTLRIIDEMVGEPTLPNEDRDAIEYLKEEKSRLEGILTVLRESIEKIKSEYPYTLKEIIESSEKIAEHRAELENILKKFNEIIATFKLRIEEMLRG